MNLNSQEKIDKTRELESVYRRFSKTGLWRLRIRRYVRSASWRLVIWIVSFSKRVFDIAISLFLVVLLSPVIFIGWLLSGRAFKRTPRIGRWLVTFNELSFENEKGLSGKIINWLHIKRLPTLINILKGDMSFVGPLPASPGDHNLRDKSARKRHTVRPGLISLWWIRKRANINYGTELDVDMEYVQTHSLMSDLGICFRAIPAIIYGEALPTASDRLFILGIKIDNYSMAEAIDTIISYLDDARHRQVCFVNADCANIAYKNSYYKSVLNESSLCFADGVGLKIAGKILRQDIAQNVNGTDMFPLLCNSLEQTEYKVFLLGARPEVVEGVATWIRTNHPGLQLCGYHHGYFSSEEETQVIDQIRQSDAHLLLVAFGAPKQDIWIHEHLVQTNVKVAIGVGGLFDFYSGRIPRAPLWMREIGMEWFYRFMQEPGRLWKRYLVGNGVFLFRVIKGKFSRQKDPV